MRLGTVLSDGVAVPAAAVDGRWRRLGDPGDTLRDLIADGRPPADRVAEELPADVRLLAPLVPGKIVAIGLNYMDHIREAEAEVPERPLVFAKFPSSIVGPEEPIVVDSELAERVDWEVELAVVIGRAASRVPPERALEHVAGYTVANDVSARDVQFADGQWVRAKSFDSFCPLGPSMVTADEVPDPQSLGLRTRVNGETVQDSTTAEMVFDVRELIAFCSRSFTLEPGDVILTGTPWGVGEFMKPRRCLQPGDVVECEVDGVGTLRNHVVGA
jgi:2-keto-4-pentenoate hydratase/2-oxohepta-3-ene-1,7-dioic acid hydratase in catechol pathway